MRRMDESAQAPIFPIVGLILVLVGVLAVLGGFWSAGFALIGVGLLLAGLGGQASWESPIGKISGAAGVVLLFAAFVIWQFFGR